MIRRGDIRWFRFASPDKRRPVVVLGPEQVLDSLSQIPVIPFSTKTRDLAWEVELTEKGRPAEFVRAQAGMDSLCRPHASRTVDRCTPRAPMAAGADGTVECLGVRGMTHSEA